MRSYIRLAIPLFFGGAIFFGLLAWLTEPAISFNELYWLALRNGSLTTALWLINDFLANNLPYSWTTETRKRLLVSIVGTIVLTLCASTLINMLFAGLQFGKPGLAISHWAVGYHISVLAITIFISLFMHGRSFLLDYRTAIIEKEEIKRSHMASRIESLQNQINPHFLFNSLNVLSSLIQEDARQADRFVQQLAQVYRYVLAVQDKEMVPLAEELQALDAYLFLLDIRFGDALHWQNEVQPTVAENIPPLSLQMLVENAIKHNVVSQKHPLSLRLSRVGEHYLKMENNVQQKEQDNISLGIGLQNIEQRFTFLSDRPVKIDRSATHFSVSLPILAPLS